MADHPGVTRFLSPGLLGRWIAENVDMWQMDLLDASKFAWFLREKGIEDFHEEDIRLLWKLRLLKADLVISSRRLRSVDLIELETDDQGRYIYADERRLRRRKRGMGNSAIDLKTPESWLQLHFHPFRYYVMYHIDRVLKLNATPMQMLRSAYLPQVVDLVVSWFNQWSSQPDSLLKIDHWNNVAALAIAIEPYGYQKVFNRLRYPLPLNLETQRERITQYFSDLSGAYSAVGIEQIELFRQELCINAEMLDPNKRLHIMIRLMKAEERLKLKGRIGGCTLLLTMAEMLRVVAEQVFNMQLPEEDEKGFGWTPPNAKKRIYGSDRILDGNRRIANEFMRQHGLDYNVRVRCYVEGDTEFGALESVFERYNAIDLVNLAGSVIQKRGKGVAFRESLRSDLDNGIFSIVVIDGDRPDNIKAVRKAAEDDEICGMFFISEPDFEFANFTRSELEEILWDKLNGQGISDPSSRQKLKEVVAGTNSGKEILSAAKKEFATLYHVDKGKPWGETLMDYARRDPEMLDEQTLNTKTRPIVEIVQITVQAVGANYQTSRSQQRVDPQTGRPIVR